MKHTRQPAGERGQVLALFAGGMIGILALAALAIDLSSVYSTQQTEKAATDAAALAGAQNLGIVGSQSATVQKSARDVAWATLVERFGITGSPTCDTTVDGSDCPLGASGYHAFISTPAKTTPTNQQSLQVTLTYPNFQLSFARLLGQNDWNVWRASVAVTDRAHKYAVMTLQPPAPKPNGTDANLCKNLVVSGTGTKLNVLRGDIGTNTSATTTNTGVIALQPGYVIDHIDDIPFGGCSYSTPDATWKTDVSGFPQGNHIGPAPLIQDPGYPIALFTDAPSFASESDPNAIAATGLGACGGLSGFPTDSATVVALTPPAGGTLRCYKPGIYSGKFSLTSNKDVAYLMPGAYKFNGGMKLGGLLAGGLIDNTSGVVLVFPQSTSLDPNNAVGLILNAGSWNCSTDSCRGLPAKDFTMTEVKTTPEGLTISIEVPRDGSCFASTNPILGPGCNTPPNATVTLGGGGRVKVAGVIYAPSDNVSVAGNSSTTGYVGQIIAWTVTYSGQGTLNQDYPGPAGSGVLRLDKPCSGGNTACIP